MGPGQQPQEGAVPSTPSVTAAGIGILWFQFISCLSCSYKGLSELFAGGFHFRLDIKHKTTETSFL